jgi:hypothetical protein
MSHMDSHQPNNEKLSWNNVVSEDEQFWVWAHFTLSFAARGEYHDAVSQIDDLREILESWQLRLDLMERKNSKKTGNRYRPEFIERMKKTFCPAHADGIKEAFKNLIKIQLQQRALIDRTLSPDWTVSAPVISNIQILSQNLS